MTKPDREYCLALFKKLSKPIACGMVINEIRYQKSKGEWSNERIFITRYIRSEHAFMHPKLQLYCLEHDTVTYRNLDFDLFFL